MLVYVSYTPVNTSTLKQCQADPVVESKASFSLLFTAFLIVVITAHKPFCSFQSGAGSGGLVLVISLHAKIMGEGPTNHSLSLPVLSFLSVFFFFFLCVCVCVCVCLFVCLCCCCCCRCCYFRSLGTCVSITWLCQSHAACYSRAENMSFRSVS